MTNFKPSLPRRRLFFSKENESGHLFYNFVRQRAQAGSSNNTDFYIITVVISTPRCSRRTCSLDNSFSVSRSLN